MSLSIKWHLREAARFILSIPFMTTSILIATIAIRMMQFHEMGLNMYPGLETPKNLTLVWALDVFWSNSLAPLLPCFLFTLAADALIRRYLLRINEV